MKIMVCYSNVFYSCYILLLICRKMIQESKQKKIKDEMAKWKKEKIEKIETQYKLLKAFKSSL